MSNHFSPALQDYERFYVSLTLILGVFPYTGTYRQQGPSLGCRGLFHQGRRTVFNAPPKRTIVASVLALSLAVFVFASGSGPLAWTSGPQAQPTPPIPATQPAPTPTPAPTTVTDATTAGGQAEEDVTWQAAAGPQLDDDETAAAVDIAAQPEAAHAPRVGIQAGHWLSAEMPDELARLRTSTGTSGGGVPEWQDSTWTSPDAWRRFSRPRAWRPTCCHPRFRQAMRPMPSSPCTPTATSPARCPASSSPAVAGPNDPAADKALIESITRAYGDVTGLGIDSHISRNMTGYYAFSNRRLVHAVGAATPAVILEMGFMTNRSDLRFMLGSPDTVAQGIAEGITAFLQARHIIAAPA